MTVRRSILLLVGLVALSSVPASAGSSPNEARPPRIRLVYKGEVIQKAAPYTYCWSRSNPDGTGEGLCADGLTRYPDPVSISAPTKLVIRIPYRAKPTEWYLVAYRSIIRRQYRDEPVGPEEKIPFRLRPHRVNGVVRAWKVVFNLDEPLRHYYLETGGDLAQGDVHYTLHVRS
jgi:hypothetical protein